MNILSTQLKGNLQKNKQRASTVLQQMPTILHQTQNNPFLQDRPQIGFIFDNRYQEILQALLANIAVLKIRWPTAEQNGLINFEIHSNHYCNIR